MVDYFPQEYFRRHDSSSDFNFYSFPRKVVHIDTWAIAQLRDYYAHVLPQDAVILDMMSSWRSHLPDSLQPKRVIGLGMNAEEMEDNPQLNKFIVHNLNDKPQLPYEDKQFDAVLCAVSVQYLTQPAKVFADVNRVLKPNGQFIVSFSNRCFPTKAVEVWLQTTDNQHMALVTQYFEMAGNYTDIEAESFTPPIHDPLFIISGRKAE